MKNYTRVRLTTDKYENEGASKGDIGAIIEVYLNKTNPNNYLLELYYPKTGTTKAIIVVKEGDIEPLENR